MLSKVKKSNLASKARDDSVTAGRIDQELLSELYESEQPHYILFSNSGIFRDDSTKGKISKANDDWQIVVTDIRIILRRSSSYAERAKGILLSDISSVDYQSSGHGRPKGVIRTQDHTYSFTDPNIMEDLFARLGVSDKSMIEQGRIEAIGSYVDSKTDDKMTKTDQLEAGLENLAPIWEYELIDSVEILTSYGIDSDTSAGNPALEITPSGLSFVEDIPFKEVKRFDIPTEEIDFEQISTTAERDFSKENRSRYVNVINPILDDSSATKKRSQDVIEIPLLNGKKFVRLTPGTGSEFGDILDGLSMIDPRLTQIGPENAHATEEATPQNSPSDKDQTPTEILEERLAEGDISVEEFKKGKEVIED